MVRIVYADGPNAPRCSPAAVMAACRRTERLDGRFDERPDVLMGWTPQPLDWIDDADFRATTVLPGYGLADAVRDGRVVPLPIRLSAVSKLLHDHPADVAVVAGVRRGDRFAYAGSVGWADVAARTARVVVVEVDDDQPDLGTPEIEGNIAATIGRDAPQPPVTLRPPDRIDEQIAAHVVGLLPNRATVQFGLGAVPDAIAARVERPVRLWSGLVTEAMATLLERGLLDAPAVAAYTWGGSPIVRLHEAGMLDLRSVSETHDVGRLASLERFVAINAALQVGLDGSVNVERVGGRTIAGIGGHADFSAGASHSPGGLSVVALRSADRHGRPTIVEQVEVVSTPRCDVDVVVTEHGVADLRGVGDAERARRLRTIAG